jgi:ribonuclease HI
MVRQGKAKQAHERGEGVTLPVAYTDGACLGNPGPGGWGVRILYPDGTVAEYGGAAIALTTNNQIVVTDSRYVIDGVTQWIHGWRRRNWLTASNTPVKNRQLWIRLDDLNHRGVRWQHVRGHSGDPDNERVDDIARGFAQGTRPVLFKGRIGDDADPVQAYLDAASTPAVPQVNRQKTSNRVFDKPRYVSIVHGQVTLDNEWALCSARVRGVSGALYKKVRNAEELAVFCAKHGVEPLPDL